MRMFVIIISRPNKLPVGYPPIEGPDALVCMETLHARGHQQMIAQTTANGITEELTLQEMREIYGDEPKCQAARLRAENSIPARAGFQFAMAF